MRSVLIKVFVTTVSWTSPARCASTVMLAPPWENRGGDPACAGRVRHCRTNCGLPSATDHGEQRACDPACAERRLPSVVEQSTKGALGQGSSVFRGAEQQGFLRREVSTTFRVGFLPRQGSTAFCGVDHGGERATAKEKEERATKEKERTNCLNLVSATWPYAYRDENSYPSELIPRCRKCNQRGRADLWVMPNKGQGFTRQRKR